MSGDVNLDAVAETETVELDPAAEIERLAALDPIAYESVRKKMIDTLGIRAPVLDKLVKAARQENGIDGDGDGDDLGLFEPEPWTHTVDGAALLDDIVGDLCRYMVMPRQAADVVALWAVHTHCFDFFRITPRLHITAPHSGYGKSTLLDVLETLVLKPVKTENLSTAVFFRIVAKYSPTLLIDEVDTFLRDNEELRGCINSGHKRGGQTFRCEGDNNEVKPFATFAPAALCGIGKIPLTLANRSFRISLQKRMASEPVADFRDDRAQHLRDRASQIARWVRDHEQELRAAEPELPADVINRLADNWRPLVAIADAAGGEWPDRARKALTYLKTEDDKESAKIKLLADMWAIFDEKQTDRLPTKDFVEALNGMEEGSWSDFNRGKGLTPTTIGKLLNEFEKQEGVPLHSRDIRTGQKVAKGYYRDDLANPYRRYVEAQDARIAAPGGKTAATPLQPRKSGESQSILAATSETNVAAKKAPNPAKKLNCSGVAANLGGKGPNARAPSDDIPAFLRRCSHCGRSAGTDNPILEVHDGDRTTWLHRGCQTAWLGATDTGAAMAS